MTTDSKLQEALFQAAKVGNVKLMREFISTGADPFLRDKNNRNAFFYALLENHEEAFALLEEFSDKKQGKKTAQSEASTGSKGS